MSISIEQFIDQLSATPLMTRQEAVAIVESLPLEQRPCNGEDFARELVRRKKLTPYQAEAICVGNEIVLGNYVILYKLGQGGMGIVLKAEHRRMRRLVALKVLADDTLASPAASRRFLREVEAAARLEHPNIVTAFDAGEASGRQFLAMQFVDGTNLSAIVTNKGTMSVEFAVRCVWQAAQGLAYAHQRGVIHRDVKPSNLMLDTKGTVKVLDLGLARLHCSELDADKRDLTNPKQIMGTVDYMAPEQALSPQAADARSDIYSLGITLWFLLTGRAAHEGESLTARLLAHQQEPTPSLSAVCEEVPFELDSVFQKMVAKDPDERYASMVEVLNALEEFSAGSTAMPTLSQAPSADNNLNVLLEGLACPDQRKTNRGSTTATMPYSPAVKTDATVNKAADDIDTETKTYLPSDSSRRETLDADEKRCWWRSRRLRMSAAVGAMLLICAVTIGLISREIRGPTRAGTSDDAASKKQSTAAFAIAPFDDKQARAWQQASARQLGVDLETINSIGMKVILIPAGEFSMGSPQGEIDELVKQSTDRAWIDRTLSEAPQHRVSLSKPYYLGVFEVTQKQYELVMNANPSHFTASGNDIELSDHPVDTVTWLDAVEFCNRLSEREGLPLYYDLSDRNVTIRGGIGYRLPTAAEWEYACRGGSETPWYFGSGQSMLRKHAWYESNSNGRAHRVGELEANPFGLYDMHGNVWEWCQDWHAAYTRGNTIADPRGPQDGALRSLRGGSFLSKAEDTRAAYRDSYLPYRSTFRRGFRVARTPTP